MDPAMPQSWRMRTHCLGDPRLHLIRGCPYRIPRVFGDKFCDKFGDLFGDSPYFVINLVTMLVTYFLSHQTCHNFW